MNGPEGTVRAAGGVILRRRRGRLEVALVHRPRYDDWTFPKGKAVKGERDEETALREVEEETGLRCALGKALGSTRYRDRFGQAKAVRYWLMTPVDGSTRSPNDEVDEIEWLPLEDAAARLTYPRDRRLLGRLSHGSDKS